MLCLRLSPSRLVAKSQVLGGFRRPRRLRRFILGDPTYTSAAKAATAPPRSSSRVGVHQSAISAAKAAMFTPSFSLAHQHTESATSAAKAASPPWSTLAPFGVPRTYTSAAKAATKVRAQGPGAKRGAPLRRVERRFGLASRPLGIVKSLGLFSMATWRSPSHFYSLPINIRALTSSNASSVVAGFNGELQQTATGIASRARLRRARQSPSRS